LMETTEKGMDQKGYMVIIDLLICNM